MANNVSFCLGACVICPCSWFSCKKKSMMTKTPRTKKKCVEPERISGAVKRGSQHRVGGGCDQCKDIPKGEIKHC